MLAYGPSEAPLTPPIQSRERSRSLYHRRRVLHTSSGPPLLSSCGTDRAVRKHRHMVAKRKDTEVVSQCHVGRGAYPVDCHHLARRLDDDQVLELEDMFDQDTCRLSWGARDRRSVHRWEDQASPRRIGAFVYTVGLRAAPRGRDSVHRWEDQGSLRSIWGVCVHCWAAGLGCGWPWDRNSVHKWDDQDSLRSIWGVCVHCWAAGLGCGWPWDRNSVHKWEDQASPRRIGAFVYTIVSRATRGARRWETGIISKHTSRETRYASIAVKATNSALAAIRPRMMAQAAGWARFIVQPMPKRLGRNKLASSRLR